MVPASFVAYDASGNAYTILTGSTADAKASAKSLAVRRQLKTAEGQLVNRLEKGKYEVLVDRRSGIIRAFQRDRVVVTTDDPDAP